MTYGVWNFSSVVEKSPLLSLDSLLLRDVETSSRGVPEGGKDFTRAGACGTQVARESISVTASCKS
ncbi:hypothetical protein QVA66_11420, partial [Staphylococcus chromogenes]|nr:hypothetical protein [Staphylococcus chromogenes]